VDNPHEAVAQVIVRFDAEVENLPEQLLAAKAPTRRDESCRRCLPNVVLRPDIIGCILHIKVFFQEKPTSRWAECSTMVL
jgi:hypothetical protein